MAKKSIEKILSNSLNEKELSEIMPLLMIMMGATGDKNHEVLANLTTFLETDTLVTLLKVFAGTTIQFPSLEDYRLNLLTMMVVYELAIEKSAASKTLESMEGVEKAKVDENYNRLIKSPKFISFLSRLDND